MKKSKIAVPAALLSMVCVQGGASIAKQLFPALGAVGTSTLRIGLSAILLSLINRPRFSQFTKQQWFYSALYGTGIAAMNLIFYMAIQRIPLGMAVTLEFVGPLFLALVLSRKFLDIIWALLACVGILLIVPWGSNAIDPIGMVLALVAGAFWAMYIVMGSKVSKVMVGKDAVTTGMLIATILIIPFSIWDGGIFEITAPLLLLGFGVAVFSSALPFTLDLIALKHLSSKTFSILTSLQPAFAAFSGLLFLNESLSLMQWLSICCVVAASIGTTLYSQSKEAS